MPRYDLVKMSRLIPADIDVIHDAARIRGYRRLGNFLCMSDKFGAAFMREIQELQAMKSRADERRAERRADELSRKIG